MSVGFHTLLKQDVQSTQHVGNQVINLEKTVISPKIFLCAILSEMRDSLITLLLKWKENSETNPHDKSLLKL